MATISSAKHNMRGSLMDARDTLSAEKGLSSAEAATKKALDYLLPLEESTIVALYWPLQNELDPRFLMGELEKRGIKIALPVVITPDTPLVFRLFGMGDELERGIFNTHHPVESAPEVDPDVVIVPGLGFDRDGYRLGYGGGFYDRTLVKHVRARAIGFSFYEQVIDYVPRAPHDRKLEAIITDTAIIKV